ncbi:LOW QUALITY PROTEIN: hypothetical protein ACHAW6_003604 [Cyclotella cf. meneghiniana]
MITSLNNLANAAVQKTDTVKKLAVANRQLTDTISKLEEENTKFLNIIQQLAGHNPWTAQHQSTKPKWDTKGYCHTHGYKEITAKPAGFKKPGHQDNATRQHTMGGEQIMATKRMKVCSSRDRKNKADYKIINSVYFTPGCTNPPSLKNTALLDTSANISRLIPDAPAGDTRNATLLLPKLPPSAKQAYCMSGLTNNLLSAAVLADAGCEVFFQQTGCEVTHNGEPLLQGWHDPTIRLWQAPLTNAEGNIVPHDAEIVSPIETTLQANSIYKCENTNQLINFCYATMGSPVVSTWCKVIVKGYS